MKKIALVFLLAVFVPSLVLAWLAVRSLRDQQMVLERHQSLLYQGVADALAKEADDFMAAQQHEFGRQVEALLAPRRGGGPRLADFAATFDDRIRSNWPVAQVGFVVTTTGKLVCPVPPACAPVAKVFYNENAKFLATGQSEEVYWNGLNSKLSANNSTEPLVVNNSKNIYANTKAPSQAPQMRNVIPQQQAIPAPENNQYSKIAPSEAEFRQLVGDAAAGTLARFLGNKLEVLVWYSTWNDPEHIYGAQLSLPQLKSDLAKLLTHVDPALRDDIAVALLDENAKPVAISRTNFLTNWKHPFVATELGEALPHWEMAVYLAHPAKLAETARTLRLTLGLLISVLLLAIVVGGWLIVFCLNRELTLARQKTDFVSNVSHELKTPLTSIRMFSELLAEDRVREPEKRRSYLHIITAEASRLTRLINNVLDFSRMERGEKKYNFDKIDLGALVRETLDTFRPHLESAGFQVFGELPDFPIHVNGDRDALAQVIVNLLSNAEKYSENGKEITLQVEAVREPLPHVDVRVLDRGSGIPHGCEQKIFEKFYRAHDSLSSGIQGSGLGLTLARQIARAHGGDVAYHPRNGGGSCFTLRLPTEERLNPA